MRVVIIGAGASGLTLASHLRKNNEDMEIIVFTKSEDIAYSPCAIPLVFGGIIKSFDDLVMHDINYYLERNIKIELSTTVTNIDSDNKKITYKKNSSTENIDYDKLVIATGSEPLHPDYEIEDFDKIFSLNNLNDGKLIHESLEDKHNNDIVFISKFSIGIESAYELAKKGYNITFLEETNNILSLYLDGDVSEKLVELTDEIKIETNVNVKSITNNGSKKEIQYNDKKISADIIIFPSYKIPSTYLARQAGCEIGEVAISINEYLETSVEDIFAIGDCVEVKSHITKSPTYSPSGTNAVRQAIILANNLTDTCRLSFKPVVNAVVSNVGNINYASCGVTESFADMIGMPIISEYLDSYQKARYYPNNNKLFIKMILKRDGTIVGCQMLSREDLSSKIDLMSFIIANDLKCEDLINMEFSYTPAYAKVINPLQEMALNIKKKNKV